MADCHPGGPGFESLRGGFFALVKRLQSTPPTLKFVFNPIFALFDYHYSWPRMKFEAIVEGSFSQSLKAKEKA